jgi:nickel transport protein
MKIRILVGLVLILFSASALYAHDTYVVKEDGAFKVIHGHDGKSEPYKPASIKTLQAYNTSGQEIPVTIKPQGTYVLLNMAQEPALVKIYYNSGAWVKTPEGSKNISKRLAKDVISSGIWEQYLKQIIQWNDRFAKPLGAKMEIVPLKNPLSLKVGDKLPFQVFYQGKPLAAVMVSDKDHKDLLKTDQNGRGEFVIPNRGYNAVWATRKTPTPNHPDADTLYERANINFVLK